MKIKRGTFEDMWRGDGAFVSLCSRSWHFLVAVRWRWHFYSVCPNAKPGYRRTYIGPFEFEWAAIRRIKPSEAEGREATNDSP